MHALPKLDWLMPIWLSLQGPGMEFNATLDQRLLGELRAKRPNLAILPVVQNYGAKRWEGAELAALLADPARSDALLKKLVAFVGDNKLQGLTVDFEEIPASAHGDLEKPRFRSLGRDFGRVGGRARRVGRPFVGRPVIGRPLVGRHEPVSLRHGGRKAGPGRHV